MNDDSTSRLDAELRSWIAAAGPGAQLPPSRRLVAAHGVSPLTVQKVVSGLVAQGLVETRPGVGTFVRSARRKIPADVGWQTAALGPRPAPALTPLSALRPSEPEMICLHSGYPGSALLPGRLVRAALTRAARGAAALRRPDPSGLAELRSWFAEELGAFGGPTPTARDVIVVPGSQSGLTSILRSVVGRGRPLLIESPSYWGAILAATHLGVPLVPVPSGPAGPDPDQVAQALRSTGARAFYAQPSYANPTGAQWSPDLAERMLAVVRAHGAFLIEDDWARDFSIDTEPRPVAALDDGGHVLYVRSLTKSVSPALRVGAIIARGPVRERIQADQAAESMYVSGVLQAAALDVVVQPAWHTQLRALRRDLRARRDLLLSALAAHTPGIAVAHRPAGGLHLWGALADHIELDRLRRDCADRGVLVAPGDEWFPAEPPGRYLRLNFSGPSPERYGEAAALIQEAIAAQA